MVSRWDIALHLPLITQKKFLFLVAEYILKVSKYNRKLIKRNAMGNIIPITEDPIQEGSQQNSPQK